MAVKSKPGRPPRAQGQTMTRLSVSIQQRYKDALELISRDRRTSLSQALEHLITAVAREYPIDDSSALAIADKLSNLPDTAVGRLQRIALIPESLQNPDEEFLIKVLGEIGDQSDITEEEALLLFEVGADVRSTGGEAWDAANVWLTACETWRTGESLVRVQDEDDFVYEYDMEAIAKKQKGDKAAVARTIGDDMLKSLTSIADEIADPATVQNARATRKARKVKKYLRSP